MTDPGDGSSSTRPSDDPVVSPIPLRVAASVLVPPAVFVALALVQLATVYDPTLVWDVTDAQAGAVLAGISGFVSGILVGLFTRVRDRALFVPGTTGLVVAPVSYLGFIGLDLNGSTPAGIAVIGIWVAVSAALFLAVTLRGGALVGSIIAVAVVAAGVGALVSSLPEPEAELVMIFTRWSDNDSGAGCMSLVEIEGLENPVTMKEGRLVLLFDDQTGGVEDPLTEIVFGPGVATSEGCRFELGNPLGLTVSDYGAVDIRAAEGDWAAGGSTNFQGNRIVVKVDN